MSLADVMAGIADALTNFYPDVNCTAYEPAMPVAPAAFPLIPDGKYHIKFPDSSGSGGADITLVIRVLVGGADQEFASEALIPYLDPDSSESIRAAVETDPTFGGACDDAMVTGWTNGGSRFEYGSTGFVGADFQIEISL